MNNIKPLFLLFTFSICLLPITILQATIRYVSPTGNNIPPYLTWEDAANSIQDCIDVSEFGDTIYVANGVYEEQVVMINGLSLIGAGIDSCIIDTRALVTSQDFRSVQVADSCLLTGFHIIVYNNSSWGRGIAALQGNSISWIFNNKVSSGFNGFFESNVSPDIHSEINIYKNIFNDVTRGVYIFNSNSIVRNNFIYNVSGAGIFIGAFDNNYYPVIDSNYIETSSEGIRKSFGTRPTITNNTIVLKNGRSGIYLSISDSTKIYNNLVIANPGVEGINNVSVRHLQLFNNYVTGDFFDNPNSWAILGLWGNNNVKHNVVTNVLRGVTGHTTQEIIYQYNNVWNTDISYSGFNPDSTNLSVDPMIVNDDTTQGELDFHLQMFSPLIDAGDPEMFDKDGSRIDIGLYGGPYGWVYTYKDLAPRPPHNVTAVYEDGFIKLTWNKNTEADFSHYRIYRDTVSNFIYDTTKIVGETTDTVFYDALPPTNTAKKFYYKLTAFDNQGNQSYPSEEINVTVTGMTEHPPIGYDGYKLLSNYPNPFNPSTKIPYRLKEAGYVKLYVYDIKGELIKILVNEWQEKGYYEVVFHPTLSERNKASKLEVMMGPKYSDMSSGVYIYQILVRGEGNIPVFSDMGKMILMK
jgi:parallel beta-helix repeat protein